MGFVIFFIAAWITLCGPFLYASEGDALAISDNIQQLHLPFGGILDPIFAAPDSGELSDIPAAAIPPSGLDITSPRNRSATR